MTSAYEQYTREEHLDWAKERALQFLDRGDVEQAWLSFTSDIIKHRGTHSLISEVGVKCISVRSEMEMREYLAALA